ncbi:hypothetical protein MM239_12320 [Belliella sp. DSM 111904]|uniref:Uncharacterized protein n=1 Tax=Belliella filtrata TaxID=2923435 RepID=A0ABS9V1U2_9BACT|nr:hypothetical protein [Belliella filtrata]MCH7410184.1 hypothetical protein [Belliella filtrata]
MEETNRDTYYLDIKDYGDKAEPINNIERKIGLKILDDLYIDPEEDNEVIIHCTTNEFLGFLARIITESRRV